MITSKQVGFLFLKSIISQQEYFISSHKISQGGLWETVTALSLAGWPWEGPALEEITWGLLPGQTQWRPRAGELECLSKVSSVLIGQQGVPERDHGGEG